MTITKEEFLREFNKNQWECQFTVNKFNENFDSGIVNFKPQDLLVQAEMFLTFAEIKFYLVYDDYFKLCTLDEDREGGYHFEEFFFIYEIELEAIKELEELVEASAQQAVRQFWLNYIKTEYEKLKEDKKVINLGMFSGMAEALLIAEYGRIKNVQLKLI